MTVHPLSLACLSLFFPGSGQLLAGKVGKAIYFALLAIFMWSISLGLLGWIINVCAALDVWASCWKENLPDETPPFAYDPEPEEHHWETGPVVVEVEAEPEIKTIVWEPAIWVDPQGETVWH